VDVSEATQTESGREEALIDELTDTNFWTKGFNEISDWTQANLFVPDTLIELGLIAAAALLAWPIARALSKQVQRLQRRETKQAVMRRLYTTLDEITFPLVWLVLQKIILLITPSYEIRDALLAITTSLLTAWVIVQVATTFVGNAFWSRTIAITAWLIAALSILGILQQTQTALDGVGFTLGEVNITALTIIQGLIALGILLWFTSLLGQIIESRLRNSPNLTPSIQVLSTKLLRIVLGTIAILSALSIVGVDLTALAVFGGAVGVGLGFGLQKIFANLISGFILLLDKSIKPGDTIAVPDYYGRVDSLGARYVSVLTRDGVEHLIPNEELITTRVENWSHSHNLLRLRKMIGVHYKSDVRKARELILEAAAETDRVLAEPKSVCLIRDFGESSVDLELRFWINDPMNGRANVTSEILQRVWDKFHDHNIEIPYPQRDLHLRSSALPAASAPTQDG
jgi:small-conductance mechanosensitive channel